MYADNYQCIHIIMCVLELKTSFKLFSITYSQKFQATNAHSKVLMQLIQTFEMKEEI